MAGLTVALAGATGVLGRLVALRLRADGHRVRPLVRRPTAAAGADGVVGDLTAPASLTRWLDGCDVALHLATALRPGADGHVDWARNDALRDAGTANLLEACARVGIGRVVLQSVAFVQAPADDAWCRGDEPLAERPFLDSARRLEQHAAGSGLAALVLRGGLYYGPGTALSQAWAASARSGDWRVPGDGRAFVSLVHVDDMAAAVVAAATAQPARTGVIAVVDDAPLRWGRLLRGLAAAAGSAVAPQPGPPSALPSFRVSNAQARLRLGWAPRHASWRDGVAAEPWARAPPAAARTSHADDRRSPSAHPPGALP